MNRLTRLLLPLLAILAIVPSLLRADAFYLVPIATQVQGAAQYRTSVIVTNNSEFTSTGVSYTLRYRSPVDGSFQISGTVLSNTSLEAHRSRYTDDVIQMFRDARQIRDADANSQIFGTLEVVIFGADPVYGDVIARTYSPTQCGFVGTAYKGSFTTGATTLTTSIRRDTLNMNTRVNLGFISRTTSGALADVGITFYDGATGLPIGSYTLSSRIGHSLVNKEVAQLTDVFADPILAGYENRAIVVRATSLGPIEGYAITLDGSSNDGSFYLMTPTPNP
jgi:hypothetical protein